MCDNESEGVDGVEPLYAICLLIYVHVYDSYKVEYFFAHIDEICPYSWPCWSSVWYFLQSLTTIYDHNIFTYPHISHSSLDWCVTFHFSYEHCSILILSRKIS